MGCYFGITLYHILSFYPLKKCYLFMFFESWKFFEDIMNSRDIDEIVTIYCQHVNMNLMDIDETVMIY